MLDLPKNYVNAMLDKVEEFCYNIIMKNIMIAFLVLCFTASVGNTTETKENKVQTFINNEIQKTKEYQIKSWQNGKDQIARTINQIKGFFVKN